MIRRWICRRFGHRWQAARPIARVFGIDRWCARCRQIDYQTPPDEQPRMQLKGFNQ